MKNGVLCLANNEIEQLEQGRFLALLALLPRARRKYHSLLESVWWELKT
jgi:hypothetical protein